MFELHSRLQADTRLLGDLPLCRVLLAKDSQYPWLILVPRVANLREIHHLAPAQQQQLMQESCAVATLMEQALRPDKINVAALGNLVPQLHLHHVARFSTDKAWPGPIWGAHPSLPYDESTLQWEAAGWRLKLANLAGFTPLETDS
ncbi:HIT domain-containing protein [Aeromonas dhakensis]|uniref:HIT domain-containing protein n=1 Tax=Aeromonas dhakensis TaxID=196024 RepID=UPI0011167618|nr:HIT domain-containing protein [Aeromonas dhakensis]MBL0534321.1 HIT domain-containing protein [Aeromonas dhakensis]TNI31743.1 HIT family protein [Aeromonas dhakensis]TNI47253.1 HIT family protein [Aeromonas dhakensis]WAF67087.1 HIT domain-containing protein [Aeromonas dhakensis]HDZ8831057.1 HIT domain-containing protein [Aeromonas dhakensis]